MYKTALFAVTYKMQVKLIPVKGDRVLEVSMTEEFKKRVRDAMALRDDEDITDDQIIGFIYGSFKNAIDKEDVGHGKE